MRELYKENYETRHSGLEKLIRVISDDNILTKARYENRMTWAIVASAVSLILAIITIIISWLLYK